MTTFDLSRGAPTLDTVPLTTITRGSDMVENIASVIAANPKTLLYKGSDVAGHNFKGYGPLRETLAARHGVTPEQIIIRNGGMDAMTHVLTFLLWKRGTSKNPDERIAVATEVPTYDRFPLNLALHGIGWKGVPIVNGELDLQRLQETVQQPEVKLFYGIYEGQNPSSYSYSDEQMREIERICAEHQTLVLWDGAYHNLTYGRTRDPITLASENVILQYNYTKEISAGFKCGYLVVPPSFAKDFNHIVSNAGLNPNYPTQAWIHAFITSAEYPQHLETLRTLFAPRAQAVTQSVKKYSPEAVFNEAVDSGYFIEILYPNIPDQEKFTTALGAAGVTVSDSLASYPPEFQEQVLGKVRLPFAILTPEEIDTVCGLIATAHESARE